MTGNIRADKILVDTVNEAELYNEVAINSLFDIALEVGLDAGIGREGRFRADALIFATYLPIG